MVVNSASKLRFLLSKLLVISTVFIAIFVFVTGSVSIKAAPYGQCNYSESRFDSGSCNPETGSNGSASSSSQSGSDPLSNTGENYLRLLYAAIGLLMLLSSIGIIGYVLKKKSQKPKNSVD